LESTNKRNSELEGNLVVKKQTVAAIESYVIAKQTAVSVANHKNMVEKTISCKLFFK
tara:strand:+ start:4903 stop:5073 length:171 start_codon:yes stop_codon:yes gene_type:complete